MRTIELQDFVAATTSFLGDARQPELAIAVRLDVDLHEGGVIAFIEGTGEDAKKTELKVVPPGSTKFLSPWALYGLITQVFPSFGDAGDKIYRTFTEAIEGGRTGWVVLRLSSHANRVDFDAEFCDTI